MTDKKLINRKIREIIQLIQYFEWNLCLELKIGGLTEMTLDKLKTKVIQEEIFDEEQAIELIEILEKRNDLVHKCSKRLDFEKHSENIPFLNNQLRYASNFKSQVQAFSLLLVDK